MIRVLFIEFLKEISISLVKFAVRDVTKVVLFTQIQQSNCGC
ncbi:Uncharacterised protein [Mycobacterium tuberculosis]|uniref:Uncharacterized protein n=1 Tax=Mycobacterium tuberculosis TaxID=1773 RepID=A0A654TY70_MYCTX|nr:Uncharacterised protein [Mycobacterium tuberculosis]CNW86310.1 Uncharacterised protein [Mycobacterium tuberculosis]